MALSKYKSVSAAVASGDHSEILKAQADKVSKAIDEATMDRDISSLSLRLIQIMSELEAVSPSKKETAVEKRKREAAEKKAKEAKKNGD